LIKIDNIISREIIDSRGFPTIEVDVILSDRSIGRASVPSGASTGKYEAVEKRDDDLSRYKGKGVLKAINGINNTIKNNLIGVNPSDQSAIDKMLIDLDGTPNKHKLGANAMLGVSWAIAKAAAKSFNMPLFRYLNSQNNQKKIELPVPMMNILNGGRHANNSLEIQEFMIMPVSALNFKDACRIGAEIYYELRVILDEMGYNTSVGDEGGFAPNLSTNSEALDLILQAVEKANYKPGEDIILAIDCASTEYYEKGKYQFNKNDLLLDSQQNCEFLENLVKKYPIFSIEDGMAEDDWEGWKILSKKLKDKCQLVGDDLFVTNSQRLELGIKEGVANSILIKCNQIGTLTETIETINLAKNSSFSTVMSHRSGETEDNIIADLSVGLNCNQVKFGALCRSERLSKYNQLIRIEENIGKDSKFYGKKILNN